MSYREIIWHRRYLQDSRDEFPNDPWRYVPTSLSNGLPLTDYTLGELQWALGEYTRLYQQALSWPGTPTPPAQMADMRAKIGAFEDALGLPRSVAHDDGATPRV